MLHKLLHLIAAKKIDINTSRTKYSMAEFHALIVYYFLTIIREQLYQGYSFDVAEGLILLESILQRLENRWKRGILHSFGAQTGRLELSHPA